MVKEKVLVFTDWYAPGFKAGGPIRSSVNFAQQMKQDYIIYVFTSDRDMGEKEPYVRIETNCWIRDEDVFIYYASPEALNWKSIISEIRNLNPAYIYLNSMYSRFFTVYPLLMKRMGLIKSKTILAPRGMLKSSAIQYKSFKKKIYLELFKWLNLRSEITFHATDEIEVSDIRHLFGVHTTVAKISNFPTRQREIQFLNKQAGEVKIIFVGRIHPIKNLLFLLNCLTKARYSILCTVVGAREDIFYWAQCEKTIQLLPDNVKVIVRNDISHELVEELIREHHIFVLPTLGENFGHAIYEALAVGRPVLISDQTPWRNLSQDKAGWDYSLNDPEFFKSVIERVSQMEALEYNSWCRGAWNYARRFIQQGDLKAQYIQLFSLDSSE